MGNICCPPIRDYYSQIILSDYKTLNKAPQVAPKICQYIELKNPFSKELKNSSNAVIRQYVNDVYQGPLNILGNPGGYELYKKDGSLYVGEFTNGAAHGQGHFIMPNCSYFQGKVKDNNADCHEGVFHGQDGFIYEGDFSHNQFNGKGNYIQIYI